MMRVSFTSMARAACMLLMCVSETRRCLCVDRIALQDIFALMPRYSQRPAKEEIINDPTVTKHYWRYRSVVKQAAQHLCPHLQPKFFCCGSAAKRNNSQGSTVVYFLSNWLHSIASCDDTHCFALH